MKIGKAAAFLAILTIAALSAMPVSANIYASNMTSLSNNSFSYMLNEQARIGVSVEVWQVGGGMVYSENLGVQAKGTHNWSWNGTGFQSGNQYRARVVASDWGYMDWTRISTDSAATSFNHPGGVSVNTNQDSPNFGKIYVSESAGATTAYRTTTSGVYMLNADGTEAGFATGGVNWAGLGNLTPFKSTIGPDDRLYVADFSNDLAYVFSEDMTSANALIDASNKTSGQYVESIYVTGTGANRQIYLVNSRYTDARRGLIRYDIGENSMVAPNDIGTQQVGPGVFPFYPRDVARDSEGNWYMNQFRWGAHEAPPIQKFTENGVQIWAADAAYTGSYGLDIYEPRGWVAYANFYTGEVAMFDMKTGIFLSQFNAGSRILDVAFDPAGNVITVDSLTKQARIWSPGVGINSFTTQSHFDILVTPEPSSLAVLAVGASALVLRRRRK